MLAFLVFRLTNVNLGRDDSMGTWKILWYGEELAMLLQSSSYNENGSSSNILYECSIEDSGMMNRQLLRSPVTKSTVLNQIVCPASR